MNFRVLLAIVIIVVAAFAGLCLAFINTQPRHGPGALTNASAAAQNSTVLGYAEKVLAEARELYENAVEANRSYLVSVDNLSEELILNSTFMNGSVIAVGHALYKYVILQLYYQPENFSYAPQEVQAGGIKAVLLPKPENVTYTGGQEYHYLITYEGRAYSVTLFFVGPMFSSYYVWASTREVGNLYVVQVWASRKLSCGGCGSVLWLVLANDTLT
ncbi:MAG: hypothetical protein RXO24_03355 [Acidilobus sp.]